MRKVDNKVSFMLDDELSEILAKVAFALDRNKSEVIRACILLSIDTIAANPPLLSKISIEDRINHKIAAR